MSIKRTRFRIILTARLLLENCGHYLFLAQTPRNGDGYTFPGGKIEGEEYAREALVREVFEEVGLIITPKSLQMVHITQRKLNSIVEIIFFFKTDTWTGELIVKELDKFKAVEWFPITVPPKKLTAVLEYALRKIRDGKLYSEFPKKKKQSIKAILGAVIENEKAIPKHKKAKAKKVETIEKFGKIGIEEKVKNEFNLENDLNRVNETTVEFTEKMENEIIAENDVKLDNEIEIEIREEIAKEVLEVPEKSKKKTINKPKKTLKSLKKIKK